MKARRKVFYLNAIIDGHLIRGRVALSPAPLPGVLTELAKFEAERILTQAVKQAIADGRL